MEGRDGRKSSILKQQQPVIGDGNEASVTLTSTRRRVSFHTVRTVQEFDEHEGMVHAPQDESIKLTDTGSSDGLLPGGHQPDTAFSETNHMSEYMNTVNTTFMPGSFSTPATQIGELMLYDDESMLEEQPFEKEPKLAVRSANLFTVAEDSTAEVLADLADMSIDADRTLNVEMDMDISANSSQSVKLASLPLSSLNSCVADQTGNEMRESATAGSKTGRSTPHESNIEVTSDLLKSVGKGNIDETVVADETRAVLHGKLTFHSNPTTGNEMKESATAGSKTGRNTPHESNIEVASDLLKGNIEETVVSDATRAVLHGKLTFDSNPTTGNEMKESATAGSKTGRNTPHESNIEVTSDLLKGNIDETVVADATRAVLHGKLTFDSNPTAKNAMEGPAVKEAAIKTSYSKTRKSSAHEFDIEATSNLIKLFGASNIGKAVFSDATQAVAFGKHSSDSNFTDASQKQSVLAENTLTSEATRKLFLDSGDVNGADLGSGESFAAAEGAENVPPTGKCAADDQLQSTATASSELLRERTEVSQKCEQTTVQNHSTLKKRSHEPLEAIHAEKSYHEHGRQANVNLSLAYELDLLDTPCSSPLLLPQKKMRMHSPAILANLNGSTLTKRSHEPLEAIHAERSYHEHGRQANVNLSLACESERILPSTPESNHNSTDSGKVLLRVKNRIRRSLTQSGIYPLMDLTSSNSVMMLDDIAEPADIFEEHIPSDPDRLDTAVGVVDTCEDSVMLDASGLSPRRPEAVESGLVRKTTDDSSFALTSRVDSTPFDISIGAVPCIRIKCNDQPQIRELKRLATANLKNYLLVRSQKCEAVIQKELAKLATTNKILANSVKTLNPRKLSRREASCFEFSRSQAHREWFQIRNTMAEATYNKINELYREVEKEDEKKAEKIKLVEHYRQNKEQVVKQLKAYLESYANILLKLRSHKNHKAALQDAKIKYYDELRENVRLDKMLLKKQQEVVDKLYDEYERTMNSIELAEYETQNRRKALLDSFTNRIAPFEETFD